MLFERHTVYLAFTLVTEQALAIPFRGPPVETLSVERPTGPPPSALSDAVAQATKAHSLQDGYPSFPRPTSHASLPEVAQPENDSPHSPRAAPSASTVASPSLVSIRSPHLAAEQSQDSSASCTHAQSSTCGTKADHRPRPGNVKGWSNKHKNGNMSKCSGAQASQCSARQNHIPRPGAYPPGSNRRINGQHGDPSMCPHALPTNCGAKPNHIPQPGKYPPGYNRVESGTQQGPAARSCPHARPSNCGAKPDHVPHPGMIKVGENWVAYDRHSHDSPVNSVEGFFNSVVDEFTSRFGPLTTSVSGAAPTPSPTNAFDVLLSALPDSLASEFEHVTEGFAPASEPTASATTHESYQPTETPDPSMGYTSTEPSSTERPSSDDTSTQPSGTDQSSSNNPNTKPSGTKRPTTKPPSSQQPSNTKQPGTPPPGTQHPGEQPANTHQPGHSPSNTENPGSQHRPTQGPPGDGATSPFDGQPTTEAAQVDNGRASIGAHPISNASVAGLASGLCAGAVMVALFAFYLHRRRQQGKPMLGRWGSQKSAASGPYPQVAWLYDPKMSPPGSPGQSRSGSGAEDALIGNREDAPRNMEAGMASPSLAPVRPSSPLLMPLHMPPSREQSPERGYRDRSRSPSRARSTDRLRVVNND